MKRRIVNVRLKMKNFVNKSLGKLKTRHLTMRKISMKRLTIHIRMNYQKMNNN